MKVNESEISKVKDSSDTVSRVEVENPIYDSKFKQTCKSLFWVKQCIYINTLYSTAVSINSSRPVSDINDIRK